jgi:hypothetical protein
MPAAEIAFIFLQVHLLETSDFPPGTLYSLVRSIPADSLALTVDMILPCNSDTMVKKMNGNCCQ